jgi:HK97 family phage major capsid protein
VFNAQIDAYEKMGVQRVELTAAEVGKYVWSKAGFERECSVEIAGRLGKEARGFYVPMDIAVDAAAAAVRQRQQRTMSVGSATAGGYLVDTENMYEYGIWIDNLRAQSVCMMLGAQVLDGLVGDLAIPRKTGSASFYWIGEDEDVTLSDVQLGSVQLRNRTIAGGVPLTRKLLQQTSRAVETMVRADLTLGAALGIDNAILNGIGGKEPIGLYNAASVGTQSVATDGSPTWAETVGFESTVATANALVGRLAYLATPATRGNMKSTPKVANTSQFIWDGNEVNGYPAATTTQMPTNGLIFGDWSSIMVGFWGVLDLKPDEATKAASGGLVLRVFQDADVALRHPESFCKGT